MESEKGRKRPWESDISNDIQSKRRVSPGIATYERSPLPQHSGHHLRDSEILDHRKLPPLRIPSRSTATGLLAVDSLEPSLGVHLNSKYRPRSQSLSDASQQISGQWLNNNVRGRIQFPFVLGFFFFFFF